MGPVNCEQGISLREGCEVRDISVLSSNQGYDLRTEYAVYLH